MKKILLFIFIILTLVSSVAYAEYLVNKNFCVVNTVTVKKEDIKRYAYLKGKVENYSGNVREHENFIIKAEIPISLIGEIKEGQSVIIENKNFYKDMEGIIVKTDFKKENLYKYTQAYSILYIIPTDSSGLLSNMEVDIKIERKDKISSVIIPLTSVVYENDFSYVYINKCGKAEKRYVNTGEKYITDIEILSGLSGNEKVIINPDTDMVYEGVKLIINE